MTPDVRGVRDGVGPRELPATRAGAEGRGAASRLSAALAGLRIDSAHAAWLLPTAAFVAVFLLRAIFLDRSYDIFTDEVTYLEISKSVAAGQGVLLHGNPFFLHPPLFFILEGAVVALFHPSGLLIDQIQAIRLLNAVLAGVTGAAIFGLVDRLASRRAALAALAIFALDPFIIRINSRNLIETAAFMWIALGYLLLLSAIPVAGEAIRRQRARVAAAGVLFGFALLSKDMMAFLTIVPLGLALIAGMSLPRRLSALTIVTALAVYAVYPVSVVAVGLGPEFAQEKLSGLLRFLGIVKTTGFVSSGGPSFASAITRNLDVFATTYFLIAIGILSFAILLIWGDSRRRLLGLLGGSAYGVLAYSIKFGTLEEQFFYYLVLPALMTVSVAWWMIVAERALVTPPQGWPRRLQTPATAWLARLRPHSLAGHGSRVERAIRVVAPVVLAVAVGWSGLVWASVHLVPDNGYERMLAYMRANVPNGTAIGVTTEPGQFLFQGYVIELMHSPQALAQRHPRYVAVSTKQIEDGYVPNGRAMLAWLRANARPVFTAEGRSYGALVLYKVSTANAVGPLAEAPGPPPTARP